MNKKTNNNEIDFDFEAKIAVGYHGDSVLMNLKSDNKDVENGIMKSIQSQGTLQWLHLLPLNKQLTIGIGVYLIIGKAKVDSSSNNTSYTKVSIFKISGG